MWYSSVIRPRKVYPQKLSESDKSHEKSYNQQKQQNDAINQHTDDENVTCGENMHQYLLNSTLHGLRYVGETHISLFERYTKTYSKTIFSNTNSFYRTLM